jgi:parallel beta-helix repeat protein
LRDNRECGVLVYGQGQGTIEKCVISGNGLSGVETRDIGNPTVRDCDIRENKGTGIRVGKEGQGTFTGNALQRNARGAWFFDASAGTVNRTGNRPNA